MMLFFVICSWALPGFAFAGHALINHRSLPTAFSWALSCIALPIVGPLLYLIFGARVIARTGLILKTLTMPLHGAATETPTETLSTFMKTSGYEHLGRLGEQISPFPLCAGNKIIPLSNGSEAYPEMLSAIDSASRTIALSTYHFASDEIGARFERALCSAASRGVSVRVLVDFCGAWLQWSSIVLRLRRLGVAAQHFNPPTGMDAFRSLNFRYHRKLLLVDGLLGFTGGMNIRDSYLAEKKLYRLNQDVHFRIEGPIVHQMHRTFAADWFFASGEALPAAEWFPHLRPVGTSYARGVISGPDATLQSNYKMILGALSVARETVLVMTPFFLPDETLLHTLCLTSLRGVDVRLILSGDNFSIIHRAQLAVMQWLLEAGVRVFVASPPFNHAKLMTIDGHWSLIGSTNWDPRSLKFNFEFDLEIHDSAVAGWIQEKAKALIESATEFSIADLETGMTAALRNTLVRLLCSYL
ncbi:MAG TPA: phospholipase D-like domain-containing protein [Thermoanaerobaculia bacterium]|nr:phospholipase D-like domain-containing protein [Thermoanaerobaculia bacterium]